MNSQSQNLKKISVLFQRPAWDLKNSYCDETRGSFTLLRMTALFEAVWMTSSEILLSYIMVKGNSGELRVESKEGEGSEFIIPIPDRRSL